MPQTISTTLQCHPATPCTFIRAIDVSVERSSDVLRLRYFFRGELTRVRWPAQRAPKRTDELWKHTCAEAFVRTSATPAYYEFNFSPSGEWAAYRFASYRNEMQVATEVSVAQIQWETSDCVRTLVSTLRLGELRFPAAMQSLRLALTAVIEDEQGTLSYWALHHPGEKPDFHHADGFAAVIDE